MNAWGAAAVAFGAAAVIDAVPAWHRGLRARMAHAPADRWAAVPAPALGGVGIAAGTAVAMVALGVSATTWKLLGAAGAAFAVGLVDDTWQLGPRAKLAGQAAAATLVAAAGIVPDWGAAGWLEAGAAVVWVLVVVNAVNLIDNMDGLAGGTVLIAVLTVLGWSARFLDVTPGGAVALAGAVAGFLMWNLHPARLFMGDAGSMFIGVMVAGIILIDAGSAGDDLRLSLAVPIVLLAYPFFDVAFVMFDRIRRGDPVSRGGRDHSSHRLVRAGLTQRSAVGAWWTMSALSGVVAYLARDLDAGPWWSLVTALAAVYGVLAYSLLRVPADG